MQTLTIALAAFLASGIGTATGFGSSTILFPVLLLFFPFSEMLLFVGILHLATDVWKVLLFRGGIRKDLILVFGAVGAVFSVLGAELSFSVSESLLSRLLGVVLVGYAVFVFLRPGWHIVKSSYSESGGGAVSGLLAGLFGIGGPTRSAVLTAYNLDKSVYIATSGAIALFIDIPRIGVYLWEGVRISSSLMWGMLLFIPVTFLGSLTAKKLLPAIPQSRFRQFILGFLMLVGLKLLVFP